MATQLDKAIEVIDREIARAKAAEQQRDRLLEAVKALEREAGTSPYFSSPPARKERLEALYKLAEEVEKEKDNG